MVREFKRGEILVKLFSHLVTSTSSPWRRLEIVGSLQDWLEVRKDFFPDPRIHHTIEAERQRAQGEIATSMKRPPAPSSAHLSTEAGGGFPAHGLAPDQPAPLLPTPNPVPGPVPEGFMDELPPHPDPVPSSVPEGSQAEPASHSVPVREGPVDGLRPSLVPVPEEFVEDLSPLPVPVPEECEDVPSVHAVPQWLRHRSPRPRRRSQRSLHRSPGFQHIPHRASELHRGFPWSRCRPSDHWLLRRRPADRRICPGWPPGQPPELLPSFRGPLHPPWSNVCFVFVLWASGICP
ncbi:hypothetical protein CHARACLAT_001247 [Characodon lateralis]|uniref:Uncharacterized protein n=1 Tax=Characodon lateralis TaxID=208331 RepID=A0ABU7CK10_9TELE|nr:hypothetical protein [Characodon lateralis]